MRRIAPTPTRWTLATALLALILGLLMQSGVARAADPPSVVRPADLGSGAATPDGKWRPENVRTDATVGISADEPRGVAPDDLGALRFSTNTVTNGQDKADLANYWGNLPTRTLGALSELKYDFFRASSSTTADHYAPVLRLYYQNDIGNDGNPANDEFGILIWEQVYNGYPIASPVPEDAWVAADILSGNFWMRAFGPGRTVDLYDVSLAEWQDGTARSDGSDTAHALSPDTRIIGVNVGVGSGWGSAFTGYVDNIVVGFGAGDAVTANFEPTPLCTSVCYVATTGNDANGGTSVADAKRTIQAAVNQVSSGGRVIVAAGTYVENVVVSKPLSLEGAQIGTLAKGRPGAESVIKPANPGLVSLDIRADTVSVDGFSFDSTGTPQAPWIIVAQSNPGGDGYQDLSILNNSFVGNPGDNVFPGGMYLSVTADTLIEGNYFNDLGQHAVFMAGGSDGTTYRNNDSVGNFNSNFSAHDQPHTNVTVENNRAVEDDMIMFRLQGALIRNNAITGGPAASSRIFVAGASNNVTISANTLTNVRSQAIRIDDLGFYGIGNSNVTISNNTISVDVANQITGGPYSLIDLRAVGGSNLVRANTVTLSGAFGAASAINAIDLRGNIGTVAVLANTLNGGNVDTDAATPSAGILLRSTLAASSLIDIKNNVVSGFNNGVAAQALPAGIDVEVFENSLGGNGAAATNAAGALLNASGNWLGANSFAAALAAVGANVDYTPFLNSGTDKDGGAAGFQGDFSFLNVDDDSPQFGATNRVQEGVNLIAGGASRTVNIAAGSYPGEVTVAIDNLAIRGAARADTVLQGAACAGRGIFLSGSRSAVRIEDLSVTGFEYGLFLGTDISSTISAITVEDVSASANCRHGIFSQAGGVNNLTVNRVVASDNGNAGSSGRGIWVINGDKNGITITDGVFSNNNLVGIDISDGDVTDLTIRGNTLVGNGDAGIGVLGAEGPGANLIAGNTLTNNGRFGIEIKISDGNSAASGPGSLVVRENIVSRSLPASDLRDHAGIAVFKRSGGAANAAEPDGAVVINNEVSGYRRAAGAPADQDGFGIVVEGLGNVVTNNLVTNNDVGIQVQGGCNGDQNAANPCFGRGNAAQGDGRVELNSLSGNSIGLRNVGAASGLDAQQNWWGSPSGPTNPGNPGGSGAALVGPADFTPWLCSGTDTSAATGFQPNTSSLCPQVIVTITKFLNERRAQAPSPQDAGVGRSYAFPMQSSWNSASLGGAGSASYTLGPSSYQVSTAPLSIGASYSTAEVITGSSQVRANCSASGTVYRQAGYSVGNTLEEARTAPRSMTPPSLSNLDRSKHIIVWNESCARVFIAKYVNGALAQPANSGNYAYPMEAKWNAANLGGSGSANYTLSATPYGDPTLKPYMAASASQAIGSSYRATELQPSGGRVGRCGKAGVSEWLAGYSTGTSWADAADGPIVSTPPSLSGISGNRYIIVWNQSCPNPPVPAPCYDGGNQAVISYTPGPRKDGKPIEASRSIPSRALGLPQNNDTENAVSLGFGGKLVMEFKAPILNNNGSAVDIRVWETSFGDSNRAWSKYPEAARISVSQDGVSWTVIGTTSDKDQPYDIKLPWARYIKIEDVTNRSNSKFDSRDDGFDLDAVEVLTTCAPLPTLPASAPTAVAPQGPAVAASREQRR